VFANVAFSQESIYEQLEEIRANKVVRVNIGNEETFYIEHTPDNMYIIYPHYNHDNDTSFYRYYIRDKDFTLDSVCSNTKYADYVVGSYKIYYQYDSLSRLIEDGILYENELDGIHLYKYNQSGKLDSLLYYSLDGAFEPCYKDSLRLNSGFRYVYDSFGRKSEEIKCNFKCNPVKKYIYDNQDRIIEIRSFNGFLKGCVLDTMFHTYKRFEYYDSGFLKSSKSNRFTVKGSRADFSKEKKHEKYYEYLKNGLIKNETSIYTEKEHDWMRRFDHTYDYDFFTYDIYKPLDAENTKADTTDIIPIVENELINLLNEFDWSAYPAYPTISVYHNLGESTLWVAKYAESNDDEKLEMFILGYHEKIEKKAFFGLGKKQIKERKNIYMTVGLDNIKMLYQLYFSGKIDELKSKLRALDREIN